MLSAEIVNFFAGVSNPSQILRHDQISYGEAIEGGYNAVRICVLNLIQSPPFTFALRTPLDGPDDPKHRLRWQTSSSVGCMRYCQRHFHDLKIPTPEVYAFNDSPGSEFIAMEYIDGDVLSDVWMDLSSVDKERLAGQIADMMKGMRSRRFEFIGGFDPDGLPLPFVEPTSAYDGKALLAQLNLFNIGPYYSLVEWALSRFDVEIQYFDQMLHGDSLKYYAEAFQEMTNEILHCLTPETALERLRTNRDAFVARSEPFDSSHPFVLCHGDFHGRNIMISRSGPRQILAVIDWDFGGSHPLPAADKFFNAIFAEDEAEVEEQEHWSKIVYSLTGPLPIDTGLSQLLRGTILDILESTEKKRLGLA